MLNKIINIFLDVLIVGLLWLLAPILIALISVPPVYGKVIAGVFIILILSAMVFRFKRHNLKISQP